MFFKKCQIAPLLQLYMLLSLLMILLNQAPRTPFCSCENCFILMGIRILMADHCCDVPVRVGAR